MFSVCFDRYGLTRLRFQLIVDFRGSETQLLKSVYAFRAAVKHRYATRARRSVGNGARDVDGQIIVGFQLFPPQPQPFARLSDRSNNKRSFDGVDSRFPN